MKETIAQHSPKNLQVISGVGPSIAKDLWGLGIKKVSDLKGHDPERLYRRLCKLEGHHVDRCVLYVFRCAVYYASTHRFAKALGQHANDKLLKEPV